MYSLGTNIQIEIAEVIYETRCSFLQYIYKFVKFFLLQQGFLQMPKMQVESVETLRKILCI